MRLTTFHHSHLSVLHTSVLWPSLVHSLSPPLLFISLLSLLTIIPSCVLTPSPPPNQVINSLTTAPNTNNTSLHDDAQLLANDEAHAHKQYTQLVTDSPWTSVTRPFTQPDHIRRWPVSRNTKRQKRNTMFGRKRSKTNSSTSNHHGNHTVPNTHYFLESWTANPNYWIPDRYHENAVCLLASFSGIVRIRPSNSTFRGGTFMVSPEDSLGRRSNCERNSRNMFWKFSQFDERELNNEDDDDDEPNSDDEPGATTPKKAHSDPKKGKSRLVPVERSNRMLSAGFHVVGSVIEFHIAYIECLQQADKNVVTNRYRVYGDGKCINLSVSFDVGSFGDRYAYECNYIWGKSLRDVHYNQNRRFYAGEVQISLKTVRIDKDPMGPPPYAFRKTRRRCAWDSVLSWQSITITASLILVFILGFFGLCVCSNSSCHDEDHNSNLCCLCCCCRRRRRAPPPRPLVNHTPNPPRMTNHNHHGNANHRNHAPPPPPPPPPPSSMNSSRNQATYSRKPTFSTTSYSYDGNGSNPTQQSSSAMSTALETDSEQYNNTTTTCNSGSSPGPGNRVLSMSGTMLSTIPKVHKGSRAKQHLRKLHTSRAVAKAKMYISTEWTILGSIKHTTIELHLTLHSPLVTEYQRFNLNTLTSVRSRSLEPITEQANSAIALSSGAGQVDEDEPGAPSVLYLCLLYWHYCNQLHLKRWQSMTMPTSDLCPTQLGTVMSISLSPPPPSGPALVAPLAE